MNVDRSLLDEWAAACHRAHENAVLAAGLVKRGDVLQAADLLQEAARTSWSAYRSLVDAGAAPVEGEGVAAPVPLDEMDTPATRRRLSALQEAAAAGDALDRERGE